MRSCNFPHVTACLAPCDTMVRDVSRKFDPHVFTHAGSIFRMASITHFACGQVVMLVMVILVKIDFRKGYFNTIIYKYIYIIYYRTLFLLFHFDFDHFDHDHHDHMTTQKKSGGNRKKVPERFVHRNEIFLLLQRRMIRAPCVPRARSICCQASRNLRPAQRAKTPLGNRQE